jgi:hypothetical protein
VTHLAESLAVIACACIAAFVALEYLKAFKRRNDLQDKFQGFERANSVTIDGMRARAEEDYASNAMHAQSLAKSLLEVRKQHDDLLKRHTNLLDSHERLLGRVNVLDDKLTKSISDLGGEILSTVQEMKTQNAAVYVGQQQRQNPLSGRNFKP